MGGSLSDSRQQARSRVDALKTYNETTASEQEAQRNVGNSFSEGISQFTKQLDKAKNQQKRFQKEGQNSMDFLIGLIDGTRGSGSSTYRYLRRKFLEAMLQMGPKVSDILVKESIKVMGCSQEQTYPTYSKTSLTLQPIATLPISQGIYIPVKWVDFNGALKLNPSSKIGKFFYEKDEVTVSDKYKPYGGLVNYPTNKMLNLRLNQQNRSFREEFSDFYNGRSVTNLFDITYQTTNQFGVSGDYFRVFPTDRDATTTLSGFTNRVGIFLTDYYSTIQIIDPVQSVASLVNYLTGAVSIKANVGFGQLNAEKRFQLLIQRILGLCFDERREIDVSGIAKIGELDGVDDSFFELNEVDLRNIEQSISNLQQGVVEFEGCDTEKLPVDADTLVNELIYFREFTGRTNEEIITQSEKVLDTIYQNPEYKFLVPQNINLEVQVNKNILKLFPVAIASSILTPKVLLPIFTMIFTLEQSAKNGINQLITSGNTQIQSGNTFLQSGTTVGQDVNNSINDGEDFIKKYKTFVIGLVSNINEEFLKVLYEILKKDIINLISAVINDLKKKEKLKKYTIILRLIQFTIVIAQLIRDYKRCKSLVDDILLLLNLINQSLLPRQSIPTGLMPFCEFLPGKSAIRETINAIENFQKVGLPTGPMPDGSPNLMNQMVKQIFNAREKEETENGKIEGIALSPVGPLRVTGKSL